MQAIVAVPITLVMVYRAWSHKSLTPAGIVAAVMTAIAHAGHPWNLPFGLLIVFFLAGTRVTKIKHDVKTKLTLQASEKVPSQGGRTHIQVLANSGVASALTILHAFQLSRREHSFSGKVDECLPWPGDPLYIGIVANYAAVMADTFSSELGILSASQPRLVTSLKLRKVPPGTNGGVTLFGLAAGMLGSFLIAISTLLLTPFCRILSAENDDDLLGWNFTRKLKFILAMTLCGTIGSILDSLLGGWFQRSVLDTRSGKIIEGDGGKKVPILEATTITSQRQNRTELGATSSSAYSRDATSQSFEELRITPEQPGKEKYKQEDSSRKSCEKYHAGILVAQEQIPSRIVESGSLALLDNNQVNFVMALTMSLGSVLISSWLQKTPDF